MLESRSRQELVGGVVKVVLAPLELDALALRNRLQARARGGIVVYAATATTQCESRELYILTPKLRFDNVANI